MAQAVSASATNVAGNNKDETACAQKADAKFYFPHYLVLYAVTTLTGTILKIVQKLRIDQLLQNITPSLRAAAAVLVCKLALTPAG